MVCIAEGQVTLIEGDTLYHDHRVEPDDCRRGNPWPNVRELGATAALATDQPRTGAYAGDNGAGVAGESGRDVTNTQRSAMDAKGGDSVAGLTGGGKRIAWCRSGPVVRPGAHPRQDL